MKGKITLLVGGAVGYVLGTRDGRQRYEQMKAQAQRLWNDPKVQAKAGQAQDFAKDKATTAAAAAKDKLQHDSSEPSLADHSHTSSAGGQFG